MQGTMNVKNDRTVIFDYLFVYDIWLFVSVIQYNGIFPLTTDI
jgi:hypothetical protein